MILNPATMVITHYSLGIRRRVVDFEHEYLWQKFFTTTPGRVTHPETSSPSTQSIFLIESEHHDTSIHNINFIDIPVLILHPRNLVNNFIRVNKVYQSFLNTYHHKTLYLKYFL